ncbi:MAG: MaoC family dehydratase [Chloroflexi bacterium]|nr:MaoC family dehydratase [Chloroflexota bacterium]MDA1146248.1 MaoC family dehydratase [Chloroflexota bacterium]
MAAVVASDKSSTGNYFEDLTTGLEIRHATPRTITEGDQAVYLALTASRFPLFCDAEFARSVGFQRELVNDLLVFHVVFGNSVPDISLNAIANLGYASLRFGAPVYPGDTITSHTTVLGQRESSRGDTGVTWVRTVGRNQRGDEVLSFIRWVLMNKRDPETRTGVDDAPKTPDFVQPSQLFVPNQLKLDKFDPAITGGRWWWRDYEPGERIHHIEGVAIEEAEHQMAARLYQNTARAHFNAHALKDSRFGKRVIYGGHVISIARELSFNGLENVLRILAFNGGTHSNPTFAGDTIFAWTDVLERIDLARSDAGALRLRLVAVKNADPNTEDVPFKVADDDGRERYHPNVVLDLDYTVLVPKAPPQK